MSTDTPRGQRPSRPVETIFHIDAFKFLPAHHLAHVIEPQTARRAVERAGKLGVPFRVALPTYGYVMAFNPRGEFISLAAEGPRPDWPTDAIIREVDSNAGEISGLIRDWTANRPAAMRGVIWYRLPITTDKHNWDWRTLNAVMVGRDL